MQSSGGVWCLLCLLVSCFFGQGGCRPHLGQGERTLWLEAVKKGILESLGMDGPPVSWEEPEPEQVKRMHLLYLKKLQDLHWNSSQNEENQHFKRASTVLLSAQAELVRADPQRIRAVFHRMDFLRKELTVVRAELTLYGHVLDKPQSGQPEHWPDVKMKVLQLDNMTALKLPREKTIVLTKLTNSKSLTLDVQATVENWRSSFQDSLVLEVEFVAGGKWQPEATPQVVLELETTEPRVEQRRKRRRAPTRDDCEEEGRCCRKSLSISFRDIGWADWVLAPEGYTIHFCDGLCPHNYKPASMHSQVKSRLHRMTKGATPRPCCVPATYEPMVLMHYDSQGELTFTAFKDMIVSKCHCA
ncbi:inhibin beta B chain-like [Megalops cyprinoides]|uniref:inhibin beta B chain-like n=1 Tax=Megalops cyprinoides TaxID=118141 RepID=UPI0018646350|nr:inhibin beta B chain-like [Megalops cyprinoides]